MCPKTLHSWVIHEQMLEPSLLASFFTQRRKGFKFLLDVWVSLRISPEDLQVILLVWFLDLLTIGESWNSRFTIQSFKRKQICHDNPVTRCTTLLVYLYLLSTGKEDDESSSLGAASLPRSRGSTPLFYSAQTLSCWLSSKPFHTWLQNQRSRSTKANRTTSAKSRNAIPRVKKWTPAYPLKFCSWIKDEGETLTGPTLTSVCPRPAWLSFLCFCFQLTCSNGQNKTSTDRPKSSRSAGSSTEVHKERTLKEKSSKFKSGLYCRSHTT